jgi:hypothetical protein
MFRDRQRPAGNPCGTTVSAYLGTNGDEVSADRPQVKRRPDNEKGHIWGQNRGDTLTGAFGRGSVSLSPDIVFFLFLYLLLAFKWGQHCPQNVPGAPGYQQPAVSP